MRAFIIALLAYSIIATLYIVLLTTKMNRLENRIKTSKPIVDIDDIYEIDTQDIPFTSEENRPVTIIAFSDFSCEACAKGAANLQRLMCQFPGKIRVGFKAFPSTDPTSIAAACSALAAFRQGRFWEMKMALFSNQDRLEKDLFQRLAKDLGLNMGEFLAACDPKLWEEYLRNHQKEAKTLGINRVPTFFVNGVKVEGNNYDLLEYAVQKLLVKRKSKELPLNFKVPKKPHSPHKP